MSGRLGTGSRFLETLFSAGTACGLTDAELLERFVARHDETAEAAFETLVLRHGSMVFDISLKILGNTHDAQDAFQATFLILATRASSIMRRGSVASWLHAVALRVARRARSDGDRRKAREKQIAEKAQSEVDPSTQENGHDFEMLHDEVERLPRKYRQVVVLCYLELEIRVSAAWLSDRDGRHQVDAGQGAA
jgi:RNA polymerase sigma factor (sigma-70 family)